MPILDIVRMPTHRGGIEKRQPGRPLWYAGTRHCSHRLSLGSPSASGRRTLLLDWESRKTLRKRPSRHRAKWKECRLSPRPGRDDNAASAGRRNRRGISVVSIDIALPSCAAPRSPQASALAWRARRASARRNCGITESRSSKPVSERFTYERRTVCEPGAGTAYQVHPYPD